MLETVSELFYDPWVFWGVPLVLAILWGLFTHRRGHPWNSPPKRR